MAKTRLPPLRAALQELGLHTCRNTSLTGTMLHLMLNCGPTRQRRRVVAHALVHMFRPAVHYCPPHCAASFALHMLVHDLHAEDLHACKVWALNRIRSTFRNNDTAWDQALCVVRIVHALSMHVPKDVAVRAMLQSLQPLLT